MEGLTSQQEPQMTANDTPELTREVVFDLMNSPRRRYVIHYLSTHEGPIELQALANQVASWEDDVPVAELTDQQKKRVYVSLYQTHVPKLADSGVVTFDRDSGDVEITSRVDEIAKYLADGTERRPWERYYLALAVGGLLVYLVGFLAGLLEFLGGAVVGLGITLAFLVLAIYHVSQVRQQPRSPLDTLIED